ncbi:MAG: hypothetical protein PUC30_00730 [Lachnospiraceae bacterium]|nr:hypothetical protein [Lachnospiraceae bacterium]
MNKVLITGLGVAKDFGICNACNLNFSWLFNNPSTILWADKICIPKTAFDAQIAQTDEKDEKVISMFLKMADAQGLIEKIDVLNMYQERVGDEIYDKMLQDSQSLLRTFPEVVKKGSKGIPDEIIIGDEGYCGAWMSSVYADIRVAKDIDANCLFSKREHNFLKYLYGLDLDRFGGSTINHAYNEVFSLFMPEGLAVHNYAFINEERCDLCIHQQGCKDSYLSDSEQSLEKIFKWREYDELQQAKNEIDQIISLKNEISSQKDINDIVKEFKERQDQVNKNINKRFPKIKRWTKMTTVLATPITVAAAITGNAPLVIGSAVATGLAQAAEGILDIYKSKNNWVGFVNEMKNM